MNRNKTKNYHSAAANNPSSQISIRDPIVAWKAKEKTNVCDEMIYASDMRMCVVGQRAMPARRSFFVFFHQPRKRSTFFFT